MSAALVDASDGASDADSPRGSSTLSDDDVGSPSRHPRALSFPRAGADAVEALEAVEEAQRASTSSPVTADQDVEELLLLFAHERETTLERLRAARAVVHEVSTSMSEWQRRARRHLRDRRLRRIRRAAFDAWRARAACDPRRRHVLRECARVWVRARLGRLVRRWRDVARRTRRDATAVRRALARRDDVARARAFRAWAAIARVDHHHARLDLLLSHLRRRVQRRVVRDACRRWRDHLRRARDDARRDVAADASLRRAARRRLHRAMLTWHAATRRAARVKAAASRALASAEAAEAAEARATRAESALANAAEETRRRELETLRRHAEELEETRRVAELEVRTAHEACAARASALEAAALAESRAVDVLRRRRADAREAEGTPTAPEVGTPTAPSPSVAALREAARRREATRAEVRARVEALKTTFASAVEAAESRLRDAEAERDAEDDALAEAEAKEAWRARAAAAERARSRAVAVAAEAAEAARRGAAKFEAARRRDAAKMDAALRDVGNEYDRMVAEAKATIEGAKGV